MVWLGLESWFVLDPLALGGGRLGYQKKLFSRLIMQNKKNSFAQYLYLGPSNSTIFIVLGP